jgi:hypothetical protein
MGRAMLRHSTGLSNNLGGRGRWRVPLVAIGVSMALFAVVADRLTGGVPGFGLFQSLLLTAGLALCLIPWLPSPLSMSLLLMGGGAAAGCLLAELVLRLLFADQFEATRSLNARYLYAPVPGSVRYVRRLRINGGETVAVRMNSSGYRGAELRPRSSGRRVVVYGDSFIEAEFSALENTFSVRLEQELASRVPDSVEVVNAGVVGYGPDQSSLRIEDELPRLQPDLVILAIFAGNDFGDLLRNKLFSLGPDGSLVLHSVTVSDSIARDFRQTLPQDLLLVQLLHRAWQGMRPNDSLPSDLLARWADEKRHYYRDALLPGPRVLVVPQGKFRAPYDIDVSTVPDSPAAQYQKRLMSGVIERTRAIVERHRSRLLLLIIPASTDICDQCGAGSIDPKTYPAYRRSALTDALEKIARQQRIEHVNLFDTPWAREAALNYFRGGDEHWNDRGQATAAVLVANYIIAKELL